ncbi:MAG: phosphoribosylpyrophosphate synthetase [Saprospiraceae bacterium]|nr:phosphoribosylpyrophosphate synthetase [Saprospiraceae bacterium]MCB0545347.1 phosphoribosylpyrophosphate synthetase [Saprospiraceae bacterium]
MKTFSTLIEALDDLRSRGYTEDFDLHTNLLNCPARQMELHPDDFEIVEVYRFEGVTNPSDNEVLYAIESKDGLKGVLVDAYGVYADNISPDLLAKLSIKHV